MSVPDAVVRSTTTRRGFLGRVARGSVGLAVLPALGGAAAYAGGDGEGPVAAAPSSARRLPGRPPATADESYWRQVKAHFPLRDDIAPMNAANLCPAPRVVIDAVEAAMRDVDGDVSFQNRARYDALRETVRERLAAYLGASPDEIAIVRNTSEANNIIVGGLPLGPGDEVLVFDQNHPTCNVAWDVRAARFAFTVRRVDVASPPSSPEEALDAFRRALTPRTRAIAFSDVSNTTGVKLPVPELCRLARARGIHAHVDGAQTFGALRLDLRELGCDSYATSAHKWFMGPKEAGLLYVRAERIPEIWPGMVGVGWGAGTETTARGARKFETLGQRNDATTAGLAAALDFHEAIGPDRVEARVHELADALKEGLLRVPGLTLVTSRGPELSAGVVVAHLEGADPRRVFQRLYEEKRIAGAATGGLRLCPHVYNTMADVERAVAGVLELVRTA